MWSVTVYVAWVEYALLTVCPEHYQGTLGQRLLFLIFYFLPPFTEALAWFLAHYDLSLVSLSLAIGLQLTGLVNWLLQYVAVTGPIPSSHGYVEATCNPLRARVPSQEAAIVFYQLTFYLLYHARVFPAVVTDKRQWVMTRLSLVFLLVATGLWVLSSLLLPLRTPSEIVSGAALGYLCACISVIAMRILLDPWVRGGLKLLRTILCLGTNKSVYYAPRVDHDPESLR